MNKPSATKRSLINNLQQNKKLVYIFSGLVVLILVIYVFLIPVPNSNTTQKIADANNKFTSNQGDNYSPAKIEFDNFSLPTADVKLYTYQPIGDAMATRISEKIPGLTIERSDLSNIIVLYSDSYRFTYDKYTKSLEFVNNEKASSRFDNFKEENSLDKLKDIFGFDFSKYSKVSSSKSAEGDTGLSYSLRLDGLTLDLAEGRNSNLNIIFNKDGKVIYMYWTILEVSESVKVGLKNLDDIKNNISSEKKYFYKDPADTSLTVGAGQGVPIDSSTFTGNVKITSGSIVYFSQNKDSNYIIPAYKFRAKFITGDKQVDGFMYVVAYKV